MPEAGVGVAEGIVGDGAREANLDAATSEFGPWMIAQRRKPRRIVKVNGGSNGEWDSDRIFAQLPLDLAMKTLASSSNLPISG